MIEREIKATLVKKTSKKGNDYECVMLELTPSYKKVVFLDDAELELLKFCDNKSTKKNDLDFLK